MEECDENGDPFTDPDEDDEEDEDYVPSTLGIAPEIPSHLVEDEFIDSPEQHAAIERKLEIDLSSTNTKQKQYTAPTGDKNYSLLKHKFSNKIFDFFSLVSVNIICESKEEV